MNAARDNMYRARNQDGNRGGNQGGAFLASSHVDIKDAEIHDEGTINEME